MFLLLPFDSLIVSLLGISLTVLFTLLLVFIIVPAVFGVSFGIRKLYMKTLLKIFAVSMLSTNGCFPKERSAVSQKKKRVVSVWLIVSSQRDVESVGRVRRKWHFEQKG